MKNAQEDQQPVYQGEPLKGQDALFDELKKKRIENLEKSNKQKEAEIKNLKAEAKEFQVPLPAPKKG